MRQDRFTLNNLMSYIYGEQISKIPPKLYNDDAQVKYLDFGSLYTYCCHGSKEHQIRRWLRERRAYVDSMMGYYTSQDDQVTIRMNKTGYVEFEITPYIPLYLTVKWSNASGGTQKFRVGRGETKKFYYNSTTSTDQEILIPYASQIKKLDNLSNLNPSSCILSNATKLTNVEIHSTELYNINVTNNKYLRRVDLKDCTALGTVTATGSSLNLSNCKYLRYCNVYNTALTEVQLNTSGGSLIEIYYPKTIQNVQLIKQRLLETVGLPYGSGGAEIPTSLYNIDIEECPSIKKLNTSTNNSINNTFASMVYCNNLTLRNALDLQELNFDGFHRLTKVIIENMYNLEVVGFNNLLPKGETSTIKYIGLSNCPLLETMEMNCTSNDYEITFSDGAILNFGGLLALKTITSNCVLKGIKTIVLPLGLESMFFTNEYGSGYSTIQNLWSSAVCSVNTDGATPKATHVDSTYIGIDFSGMNLKNIDLGALVNIPKAINFKLSPTTVNPHFNLNRDGETYPYLKPIGTLDLSNYTESLARFFDGVDLDKLQIVCNNNLPQTDLSYCFYNSSFSSLSAIENLLTRVSSVTNLDYCFYRTTVDSLNVLNEINMGANSTMNYTFAECPNIRTLSNITISRNVTSVEGMFKGCPLTSISNITVNVAGSINGLFMGCNQLTTINTFRIPNVTDLSNVFNGCSNLTTLTGFELPSSVTNISNLFNGCYALTTIENFTFSSNITEANTWYPPYLETLQNIAINSSAVKLTNCTTLTTIRDFTLGTTDCSRMFEGCTSITSDIELPSTIVNCSNMFKNCTSITHIHSNWDNIYDSEITATDCYSGCIAITHIDEVALELNDYTSGLDQVPIAWGGYEFTKETTGLYKVNISSDNYTLNFDPNSKGFLVSNGAINWGDGTITIGETSHTYTTAGEYVIKGKVHCYSYNNTSIKESLVEVYTIPSPSETIGILSSFIDCTKLTNVTIRNQNLTYSGYGGHSVAFKGCSSMQKIDLNGSYGFTLNNTYSQFQDCPGILDLSNCSFKVTSEMPLKYYRFSEIIMRNAKVEGTMKNFFTRGGAIYSLVKVDLTGIDTSTVTDFSEMFHSCKNLTTIIGIEDLDISSATTLGYMFYDCGKLTEPPIKSIPTSVTNIGNMYWSCSSLLEDIVIPSHITDCHEMFKNCTSMTHIHSNWNNSYDVNNDDNPDNDLISTDCYSGCIGITHIDNKNVISYEGDLGLDYIPEAWGGAGFTPWSTAIIKIDTTGYANVELDLFKNDSAIYVNWGDGNISKSTDGITGVGTTHTYTSEGEFVIKTRIPETSVGGDTNGKGVFDVPVGYAPKDHLCKTLIEVIQVDNADYRYKMGNFSWCAKLKKAKIDYSYHRGSSVNMCGYLEECPLLEEVTLSNFPPIWKDGGAKGGLASFFKNCTSLRTVNTDNIFAKTTDDGIHMNSMFEGCSSLSTLNLNHWDVSKVTVIKEMFKNCSNLTILNLNGLNFSSLANDSDVSYALFQGCASLTENPYTQLANLDRFGSIDLRGCDSLPKILDFQNIPLLSAKNIFFPNNTEQLIGVNPSLPLNATFRFNGVINRFENLYFNSNSTYEYWYYDGGASNMSVTFVGEIERIPADEPRYVDNYKKGLWILDEASKTSFVNALKDYTGQETATLYGASQYLSSEQIAIATSKNWSVT